jgi:hypothetical protein
MKPPETEEPGFAAPALKYSAINLIENLDSLPASALVVKQKVCSYEQERARNEKFQESFRREFTRLLGSVEWALNWEQLAAFNVILCMLLRPFKENRACSSEEKYSIDHAVRYLLGPFALIHKQGGGEYLVLRNTEFERERGKGVRLYSRQAGKGERDKMSMESALPTMDRNLIKQVVAYSYVNQEVAQ